MQERSDFVASLIRSAIERVRTGYYARGGQSSARHASLVGAIRGSRTIPLICEVKFVSPAEGRLREDTDVGEIAAAYEGAGAAAISVITEPKFFGGSLGFLPEVKRRVSLPVMMKDVVVDRTQIDAAARLGADAILLISRVFESGLINAGLDETVSAAHSRGLEVVLEVHTEEEYVSALGTRADIIGINNRNLETLEVSLETTKKILARFPRPKPVVSESGFTSRADLLATQALGAGAFLVGSALMKARDPAALIRSFLGK